MLGARPKKMMNMYILDILKRNTDADHPMTQQEICRRLESEYDMAAERKAVKANLEDLINDGSYNIEYSTKVRFTPNRLTGEIEKSEILTGFYCNSVFTDSESSACLSNRCSNIVRFRSFLFPCGFAFIKHRRQPYVRFHTSPPEKMNGRNSSTLKTGKFFVLKFCRADIPAYFKRRNNKTGNLTFLRRAGFGHLLLIDSVLFSKAFLRATKRSCLKSLKSCQTNISNSARRIFNPTTRPTGDQQGAFYTIEMLDEAISKGLKVKFFYNEYGADKSCATVSTRRARHGICHKSLHNGGQQRQILPHLQL